jgi:hypothetical protein
VAIRQKAVRLLDTMVGLVDLFSPDIYGEHETEARKRLGSRDPDDWPILASALALGGSGPKTPTFSAVALRPGHPVEIFLGD